MWDVKHQVASNSLALVSLMLNKYVSFLGPSCIEIREKRYNGKIGMLGIKKGSMWEKCQNKGILHVWGETTQITYLKSEIQSAVSFWLRKLFPL